MKKRPQWFPMDLSIKPIIDRLTDEQAGIVLKKSLESFEDGTVPDRYGLSEMGELALEMLMHEIEEANLAYRQKVSAGRKGGLKKAENQKKQEQEAPGQEEKTEVNTSDSDDEWDLPFGD